MRDLTYFALIASVSAMQLNDIAQSSLEETGTNSGTHSPSSNTDPAPEVDFTYGQSEDQGDEGFINDDDVGLPNKEDCKRLLEVEAADYDTFDEVKEKFVELGGDAAEIPEGVTMEMFHQLTAACSEHWDVKYVDDLHRPTFKPPAKAEAPVIVPNW